MSDDVFYFFIKKPPHLAYLHSVTLSKVEQLFSKEYVIVD